MEDLIGIIIMILFAGFSLAGRAAKRRQAGPANPPKWPGPVAGPKPGQWPQQPGWAPPRPAPAPQPASPAPRVQQARAPQSQPSGWGEGVSLEGAQRSMEGSRLSTQGPAGVVSLEDEMKRFDRHANEMRDRHMSIADPSFQSLGSLHGDLEEAPPLEVTEVEDRVSGAGLKGLLATPEAAAQGIVLAEVLGRPRALRRDRRYR